MVLAVDVEDPEVLRGALDALIAAGEDMPEVRFEREAFGERELVRVHLVNAGIPALPTLCLTDTELLMTLSPQAMKDRLEGRDGGENLTADPRFQAQLSHLEGAASTAGWFDVGGTYDYVYGMVGFALGAMRMSGVELSDRFDPATLPSGELVSGILGHGYMRVEHGERGLVMEGRSSVGSPLTGMLVGTLGVAGLVALSEALQEEVQDERRRASAERLAELADAMDAYRDSVGGGAYPDDLVRLLDRGVLSDGALLVDPSDPRPRKVRTGTGERVPVSYAVGRARSLPETVRERLPDGTETVLYTRGSWSEYRGEPCRVVYALGERRRAVYVAKSDWGR